jgi:hypothetical protein
MIVGYPPSIGPFHAEPGGVERRIGSAGDIHQKAFSRSAFNQPASGPKEVKIPAGYCTRVWVLSGMAMSFETSFQFSRATEEAVRPSEEMSGCCLPRDWRGMRNRRRRLHKHKSATCCRSFKNNHGAERWRRFPSYLPWTG